MVLKCFPDALSGSVVGDLYDLVDRHQLQPKG